MFTAVLGRPSILTNWVLNAARIASEQCFGATAVIAANELEDLRSRWMVREFKPVLFHSDTPRRDVIELFDRTGGCIIIVEESLERCMRFAVLARGLDNQTALRFVTRSACALSRFRSNGNVWHLDDRLYKTTVREFLVSLFEVLGVNADDRMIRSAMAMLVLDDEEAIVAHSVDRLLKAQLNDKYNAFSVTTPSGLEEFARSYDLFVRGDDRKEIMWPPDVFVDMSRMQSMSGPIDLCGPARVLVGGHALSVPEGEWRAHVELSVYDNHSGNSIYSDVFAEDRPVVAGTTVLPTSGRFEYVLDFACSDPFFPIILRISTLEGAIEGSLNLEGVRIEKQAGLGEIDIANR